MNSFERKYMITSSMVEAYEDLIGDHNRVNRGKIPNGLLCSLIHDTVYRTLGDGAVCISLNISHIRPLEIDTEARFSMTLITGSESVYHYMITVGGNESFNVIGNLTVKRFRDAKSE